MWGHPEHGAIFVVPPAVSQRWILAGLPLIRKEAVYFSNTVVVPREQPSSRGSLLGTWRPEISSSGRQSPARTGPGLLPGKLGPPHAMEANHATPSPALTTAAGENVCEVDVFDAAVDGATLLISLCGLVGNGAVLWLLGCRIRRNPVTVYVLNLAVADFTFLLFMLTYTLLYFLKDLSCFMLPISVRHLVSLLLLSLFAHNMGMYLLAAVSIERCVSILCPLWYRCRRPQHLSAVVCALLWVLSITVITTVTSLCQSHQHEQCRLALIAMYVLNFLLFAPSMVISNIILLIKVLCSSMQRQHRRLYIVIFLTVLFFLLFGVPLSIWNFMQHFSFDPPGHHQVFFLLACINSSINPFIYVLVGIGKRHCSLASLQVAFQRVFEETGVTVISA